MTGGASRLISLCVPFHSSYAGSQPIRCRTNSLHSRSFLMSLLEQSPEVVRLNRHGKESDWWSFGIFVHELICGYRASSCIVCAWLYSVSSISNGTQ